MVNQSEMYYAQYKIDDGRQMTAKFAELHDRDGFEISLGMYRANLGPITEEVFRRFTGKFHGVVAEQE